MVTRSLVVRWRIQPSSQGVAVSTPERCALDRWPRTQRVVEVLGRGAPERVQRRDWTVTRDAEHARPPVKPGRSSGLNLPTAAPLYVVGVNWRVHQPGFRLDDRGSPGGNFVSISHWLGQLASRDVGVAGALASGWC